MIPRWCRHRIGYLCSYRKKIVNGVELFVCTDLLTWLIRVDADSVFNYLYKNYR